MSKVKKYFQVKILEVLQNMYSYVTNDHDTPQTTHKVTNQP